MWSKHIASTFACFVIPFVLTAPVENGNDQTNVKETNIRPITEIEEIKPAPAVNPGNDVKSNQDVDQQARAVDTSADDLGRAMNGMSVKAIIRDVLITLEDHPEIMGELLEDKERQLDRELDSEDVDDGMFLDDDTAFQKPPPQLLKLQPDVRHTILVISPLKALIQDQVRFLDEHNVSTAVVGGSDSDLAALREDHVSVVFTSPEAILSSKWSSMMKSLRKQICLQVYDEAHCISSWGLDFRPDYRRVSELQSLFTAPTMVLTATATPKIQKDIYEVLSLDENTKVVANLPNRDNIFLDLVKVKEVFKEELLWVTEMLKTKGTSSKKTIIYVRSINVCFEIYLWMCINLGIKAFDKERRVEDRLLEMFHANTDEDSKKRILETFISVNSSIRVLISTVAFGMGVNVPDIELVIHWGLPSSSLCYWQETGRCARDGRKGYAVCYAYARSVNKCTDEVFKSIPDSEECLRYGVLENFLLEGMDKQELDTIQIRQKCRNDCLTNCTCELCACCINCWKKCKCTGKPTTCRDAYL